MARGAAMCVPAELRGMLEELASADAGASQGWILALLREHGLSVVKVLWRMLGREQDVLDVYQTVVCQLAARGPDRAGRNRGAYFHRAAINTAIELIRRRQRERAHWPGVVQRHEAASVAPDVGGRADHLRLVDDVRHAVAALPPHLRDVIVLRDFAGFDYARVARTLSITAATARVYRRQAVLRLAARLAKEAC
jgi:RNA polymerase sigma factor (sigma-70 family)